MRRAVTGLALVLLALSARPTADQAPSRQEAERLQEKLAAILERGEAGKVPGNPLVTSVSEREINAYFHHIAAPTLPAGLVDPTVAIADRGHVTVRANIDLDAVRKSKVRGSLDPLAYVSGIVEVVLAGTLEAARGQGRFRLDTATVGGMSVPESIVQELVTYMTKTPDNPAGISLDRPFDLPARIQQIRTSTGQATIVQ